jgi:hypothetical protein
MYSVILLDKILIILSIFKNLFFEKAQRTKDVNKYVIKSKKMDINGIIENYYSVYVLKYSLCGVYIVLFEENSKICNMKQNISNIVTHYYENV